MHVVVHLSVTSPCFMYSTGRLSRIRKRQKLVEGGGGGGGNQGVRNKDALLNVDCYVDLPAPKKKR